MAEVEIQDEQVQGEKVANLPAVQEAPDRRPVLAGGLPRALVPQDFDGCWRIASMVHSAGMAPKGLDTAPKMMVAIVHGLEVGLTPMMALQTIAVINGKPTIYGDGALGLVQASGLLEDHEEFYVGVEGTDAYKAVCRVKRKGRSKWIEGEFSVADAKTAGLWTKRGRNGEPTPWQTYPKRMLKMRARWALRDGFSDVLKGLHIREEIEDMMRLETVSAEPDRPRLRAPAPPTEEKVDGEESSEVKTDTGAASTDSSGSAVGEAEGVAGNGTAAQAETAAKAETKASAERAGPTDGLDIPASLRRAPPPPVTHEEHLWLEELDNVFSACEDATSLVDAQDDRMLPQKGKVSETAWKKAGALLDAHVKRLQL